MQIQYSPYSLNLQHFQPGLEYSESIPCKGVIHPPKKGYPDYDAKLHLIVKLQFWRSVEGGISLHYYYSQVDSDSEVVPVWVPFMSQIDMIKNYSHSIAKKKLLKNNSTKNVAVNVQWMRFPKL